MKFIIFDVGHGFSGYLVADNGNVMLFPLPTGEPPTWEWDGHIQNFFDLLQIPDTLR